MKLYCILLILIVFVTACSSSGDNWGDLDPRLGEMFDSEPVSVIRSSQLIIEEAYDDGDIDLEEYLLLSAQANFDSVSLPSEYVGEDVAPYDYSMVVQMISENFDSLSPSAQEELRPYILTFDDPESYWYDDEEYTLYDEINLDSPDNSVIDFVLPVPYADAVVHKSPANHEFEIYFTGSANQAKAQLVATALVKAQNKYIAGSYPEISDWVYVKLKDMPPNAQGFITYGLAGMLDRGDGKKRCHIILNTRNDDRRMKTVVAHEFFHCTQYQMGHSALANKWLLESTATWAEHYVYPNENTEHERDSIIFPHLNKYMLTFGNFHEYGSYLWWFYLTQKYNSADIVRSSLVSAVSLGQKGMLYARSAFSEELKEYAVWNLNFNPFKFYQDYAGLPTSGATSPASESFGLGVQKLEQNVDLEPGGIVYQGYFVDEKVDKLKFDLASFTGSDIGVQVLYNAKGVWQKEDITGQSEKVFCRSRPGQEVDYVILIFTNPSLDDTYLGKLKVDATEACEKGWVGTVSFSWSDSLSRDISREMLSDDGGMGEYNERVSFISNDVLAYDKENDEFLMKEQRVTFSDFEEQKITYNRQCGYLWEEKGEEASGSGSKTWKVKKPVSQSDGPTRLRPIDGEKGKYALNLEIFNGKVYYSSYNSAARKPCGLDGAGVGNTDSYRDDFNGESDDITRNWPNYEMVLTMNKDRNKLTGEGTAYVQYDERKIPVQISAEYSYVS